MSVEEGLKRCKEKGLLVSAGKIDLIRAVTHLDVNLMMLKMLLIFLMRFLN